jgi:hypothetical protein
MTQKLTKLTSAQQRTLSALHAAGIWRSSYPGLNLRTLGALRGKGLAESRAGVGSIAFPTTAIKWRITDAGRAALTDGGRDE